MTQPEDELAPEEHLDPDERDPEASPADAAEQAASVKPEEGPAEVRRGWEVNEWDAAEQALVVDLDDEDYQ